MTPVILALLALATSVAVGVSLGLWVTSDIRLVLRELQVKVERDPALVSSPCLRVRTGRYDHFLWWAGRPRFMRYDRRDDAR